MTARDDRLPVIYLHLGDDWIRGSERVLLDLLSDLDPSRVAPSLICNTERLATATRGIGVPTTVTEMRTYLSDGGWRFNPVRLARQASVLRRHVEYVGGGKRQPVVHSNGAGPCQWAAPYTQVAGVPLVAHVHTPYLRRSRYALMTHLATKVIGVSDGAIAGFVEDGLGSDRIDVIRNGVSEDRINAATPTGHVGMRARLGIRPDRPIVMSVGSLIQRKGHDRTIMALARAKTKNATLVLVGSGPDETELRELASTNGVADRVAFVTDADAATMYREATVFALASRKEAFGLVAAEAGAAGLPTIATRTGGIPDVVRHGETGLLVSNENDETHVAGMASAMDMLLEDGALREKLGQAARRRVAELFSSKRTAAEFQDLYDEMDEGRRIARPRGEVIRPYRSLLGATG